MGFFVPGSIPLVNGPGGTKPHTFTEPQTPRAQYKYITKWLQLHVVPRIATCAATRTHEFCSAFLASDEALVMMHVYDNVDDFMANAREEFASIVITACLQV